ncbi:S-layer homology domain-containing protein [Oscillibacter sp.]|uniref:S-layer homology domain-containing protein n=1 Tax=Oscillibacter sp. TaxID=1945593 RepID=UPI00260BCEAF|nr:S-layer homology domain-containing protein [Oscillibacter sp.]MDD3347573.1 S-layer homology domain-containing protein [Oscillibacter sp.]
MMKRRLKQALSCLLLCTLLSSVMALPASAVAFSDVPQTHWAAESIRRSAELGFLRGETPTRFGLGHRMTRAAFAVALCRFFGWEAEETGESVYDDVPANAWYTDAVESAYAHGALTLQSSAFRPADPITREEVAVMLIRALGYGNLAGLVQDLPMPFRDVTSNSGYIAMAYELGLVSGTSATAFTPAGTATREQAAVMLVRLYDKLHSPAPGYVGIAASAAELPTLDGFAAVAVAAGRLIYQGRAQLSWTAPAEETAAVRAAAKSGGAKQLLYVGGTESPLRCDSAETAKMLSETVRGQGYDGLFLDLEQVTYAHREDLTALVSALRTELGDGLLYVAAEAPVWRGKSEEGYDYAALAASADRLVLRAACYVEKTESGFPAAPMEPLEEVYFALGELRDEVEPEKLSLLLTTTASVWTGGKNTATLSGAAAQSLAAEKGLEDYYSSRYACAYSAGTAEGKNTVIWYMNGEAAAQRTRLAAFFGVDQVCFSQLEGLRPALAPAALK